MIKINKGTVPQEWIDYCCTPGVEYSAIPQLVKALYKEQGYICAYCMRRIPVQNSNSNADHKVEHILCRERYPEKSLDYSNMVICCPGAINGDFHCDTKKGNNDVTFDLFSDHFIDTISYGSGTGEIKSSNPVWNGEINNLLNLNNGLLKANRRDAISAVIKVMGRADWRDNKITTQLKSWENIDRDGKRKEYCGVVIWFLKKKLSR